MLNIPLFYGRIEDMDVEIIYNQSAFKHNVTEADIRMAFDTARYDEMTEEEAAYWDEYYTKNPPKIDPTKKGTGFFTRHKTLGRTITVDTLSADYLTTKAIATNKTPAEIIGELVRKELKAAV